MISKPARWRTERGGYFKKQIDKAITNRGTFMERRKLYRDMIFREPGGTDASEPFEGAADLHLPVILEKIESAVPKVMSALWRANPFTNVKNPGGTYDRDRVKKIENYAHWAFHNDIPNMYLTLENFLRNMLADGTAFAKIVWDRKWRRAVETHIVKILWLKGEKDLFDNVIEEPTPKTADEILYEVFGIGDGTNTLYDVQPKGKNKFFVKFTEDNRPYEATVYVEDGDKMDEALVKVHRRIISVDAPRVDNIELDELVLPFRATSLQDAKWVAHKTWYSYREIEKLVAAKKWKISKRDMLALKGVRVAADTDSSIQAEKDDLVGESGNPGMEESSKDDKFDPNEILVWEVYAEDYVDDDIDEPINVIHFIPDYLEKVVGIEYMDEVFPHGQRPFISATYIPVGQRVYGMGMGELLYAVNLEIDHTLSSIHNGLAIKTNPWFLYTPFGMANNSSLLAGVKPGQGVPTADPQGVRFPEFAQNPSEMYQGGFQQLLSYADRLTFSPMTSGNTYRNAPRTAKGTQSLMEAAEEHLSSMVEQLQATAWKDLVNQVMMMYGRYVSVDKWYSVTGEANPRRMSPKDLRENYLYSFSGSLTSVNRDLQRSLAQQKYATVSNDPLYQSDPHARQELLRSLLTHFDDDGNADALVPDLPGEGGFSHPPMDQDTELRTLAQGIYVAVLPTDNDAEHLKAIEAFKRTDSFKSITSQQARAINQHQQEHEAALQYKMQQQNLAQQMGGQGMGMSRPSEPGSPAGGVPAMGGELSAVEGGPQVGGNSQ